jgi:hypothetical protein
MVIIFSRSMWWISLATPETDAASAGPVGRYWNSVARMDGRRHRIEMKFWLAKPHRILAPQVPRSTELQFRPPRRRQPGNSLPGENESDGLRAFDAPALKRRTADGAEAPYSGASGTMRQRAESQQPTFGDCTHLKSEIPSLFSRYGENL